MPFHQTNLSKGRNFTHLEDIWCFSLLTRPQRSSLSVRRGLRTKLPIFLEKQKQRSSTLTNYGVAFQQDSRQHGYIRPLKKCFCTKALVKYIKQNSHLTNFRFVPKIFSCFHSCVTGLQDNALTHLAFVREPPLAHRGNMLSKP